MHLELSVLPMRAKDPPDSSLLKFLGTISSVFGPHLQYTQNLQRGTSSRCWAPKDQTLLGVSKCVCSYRIQRQQS